jgi:large subunit ribosomal protein L17
MAIIEFVERDVAAKGQDSGPKPVADEEGEAVAA